MSQITKSIKEKNKPKQIAEKRKHTRKLKLKQINSFIQLDKRFQNILLFTNLKLFEHYRQVF